MWSEPIVSQAPASLAVSVADAKIFLRVDADDEDSLIETFIKAATARAEATTGTRFVSQEVIVHADDWSDLLTLPIGPVQSVNSIGYTDIDGVSQQFGDFELFGAGLTQSVRPAIGSGWPNHVSHKSGAIRIEMTVGYEDLPESLLAAVLLMVGDLYANRETVASGVSSDIPTSMQVETLLAQHRIWL